MTSRHHLATDDDTLPEIDASAVRQDGSSLRDVCFLDFKDGMTTVSVSQGPLDPSRICIALRSRQAVLQLTVEEGVGRRLAEGLAQVLPTFRETRSRLR